MGLNTQHYFANRLRTEKLCQRGSTQYDFDYVLHKQLVGYLVKYRESCEAISIA